MASHEPSPNRSSSSTGFGRATWYGLWFLLISTTLASTWGVWQPMRRDRSPLSRQKGKSPILAKSIVRSSKKPMGTAIDRKQRRHFLPSSKARRVLMPHFVWELDAIISMMPCSAICRASSVGHHKGCPYKGYIVVQPAICASSPALVMANCVAAPPFNEP